MDQLMMTIKNGTVEMKVIMDPTQFFGSAFIPFCMKYGINGSKYSFTIDDKNVDWRKCPADMEITKDFVVHLVRKNLHPIDSL